MHRPVNFVTTRGYSSRAAKKILAQLSKGSKLTADALTKLIAAEFNALSA